MAVKLGNCTNLRRSFKFSGVDEFSLTDPCQKLKKPRKGVFAVETKKPTFDEH